MLDGPGDSKCWGPSPRFDEPVQRYIDYLDERAVPRSNPTKLYSKLPKRDIMRFDSSETTVFATSQIFYDVVKWTCIASVTRSEVEALITTLRLSGIPPARNVPDSTPASSDEEDRKNARTVRLRFLIPPSEDVEKAFISSASIEAKNDHNVYPTVKENERADSPDDESDDDLRRANRYPVPQGVGSNDVDSPPGLGETPNVGDEPQGLWSSKLPRRNWVKLTKARTPIHASNFVSRLCSYLFRHDKSISHGHDGGVAIPVILNEMRIGAGGDSGRTHVHGDIELIEMLEKAFYLDDDVPLAMRAIQGHSVIEAKPTLMEW